MCCNLQYTENLNANLDAILNPNILVMETPVCDPKVQVNKD